MTIEDFLRSPTAAEFLQAHRIGVTFRQLLHDELTAYLESVRREAR